MSLRDDEEIINHYFQRVIDCGWGSTYGVQLAWRCALPYLKMNGYAVIGGSFA